jgi:Fis family transcriptional regulator
MNDWPINENDIAKQVRKAVNDYFKDLDGEEPSCGVYDMVMCCAEKPLIETVLLQAEGNQTRTAELLGINRNTLRKKMQQYKIK